jgi:hypothetical protein
VEDQWFVACQQQKTPAPEEEVRREVIDKVTL